MINCEIELILTWSKNCVLADMTERDAGNNNDLPAIVAPNGLEFQITDRKLYVPVVTFSTEYNKKLLEQLTSEFERNLKWNTGHKGYSKYQWQLKLFNWSNIYVPNVKRKDFNVLIDGKSFFDLQVKNEEEGYGIWIRKRLLKWAEIMTIQLVIYWILLILKKITD